MAAQRERGRLVHHHLDEFDDQRQWLRPPPRPRRRLLLALPLVVALTVAVLSLGGRGKLDTPPRPGAPPEPTADQLALDAGRKALQAWGRFAVTNRLGTLRGWFWPKGPQFQQLAREARLRRGFKALGPPAYRFTLTRVRVLAPSPAQRVLRGRVLVTRPGERGQAYSWDIWMRRDASADRWRLWTVKAISAPRSRSAADPVVVAAGDIAMPGGHPRRTSDRVLEQDPDAVLALGDNQYPSGRLSEYRSLYDPTWGRFKARTRPVPGNHEYATTGAAGYFAYFGRAARPEGHSYYSFDLGGWHLIALNSSIDHGPGSAQERWLRADLMATAKRCILAYWHFPRFSSGAHQGNWPSLGTVWNDLYDARADLVLSGHEHVYERFAPQTPWAKASRHGIRQFVVGTGGAQLLGFARPQPNSQVRIARTHGVLKLVLHPSSYEWRFISESGSVLDKGGPVACH